METSLWVRPIEMILIVIAEVMVSAPGPVT